MITVLRYGHRAVRDKRTTTHVGLVARTFGADRFIVVGSDSVPVNTVNNVTERWGGDFKAEKVKDWRSFLKNFKGIRIHLTMYGKPLSEVIEKLQTYKKEDVLIFIGAEKVPADVYETCEFNVAVGNQPHSEIAALAIFLDRFTGGKWEKKKFKDAKLVIKPQERGKKMESF